MRRLAPLLLLLVFIGVPLVAGAQVYKWTDANGTVHYADAPPPNGAEYKDVKVNRHAPSDDARSDGDAEKPRRDRDTATDEADGPSQKSHMPDTPDNREKLCSNLTSNIKLLESDGAVVTRDGGGHEKALTGDSRSQELARAQQQYRQFCRH